MMWLRRAMGMQDMEQPQPVRRQTTDIEARFRPPVSPIENNPVGWSSTYAPEVATNASPDFSPLASSAMMTPEQKLGRFWNVATGRPKPAYTNADLPQLTAAGNEGVDAAMGWAGMTTPTIRAFHGSPHTFDRFDLSKIGTGEGAQAYGHGLYFAGRENVAESYKHNVFAKPDPAKFTSESAREIAEHQLRGFGSQPDALALGIDDLEKSLHSARFKFSIFKDEMAAKRVSDLEEAVSYLKTQVKPGSMYEVNLRTSPERLLDWDKPLAQQPAIVQDLARSADLSHLKPGNRTRRMIEMWREGAEQPHNLATGHTFHNAVSDFGSQSNPALSETLRKAGLDGIQYLDQGSRAAGDGSRNYVMFRDDIIDVLKRYGLFGLGMVGASQAGPYGEANP